MRRKPKPDTRPHWNDDLKILHRGKLFDADEWKEKSKFYLEVRDEPHYSKDPTYNLRIKNVKGRDNS